MSCECGGKMREGTRNSQWQVKHIVIISRSLLMAG